MEVCPQIHQEKYQQPVIDLRTAITRTRNRKKPSKVRKNLTENFDKFTHKLGRFAVQNLSNLSFIEKQRLEMLCISFFTPERIQKVLEPITCAHTKFSSKLSLKTLEWAVINYARRLNVSVYSQNNIFLVYESYRNNLSYWRRSFFDAFRRGKRIYFLSADGVEHETTAAQLNYIYWAETNGVLKYALENLEAIENDMKARISFCNSLKKSQLPSGSSEKKRKRNALSQNPLSRCVIHEKVTVSFFQKKQI